MTSVRKLSFGTAVMRCCSLKDGITFEDNAVPSGEISFIMESKRYQNPPNKRQKTAFER